MRDVCTDQEEVLAREEGDAHSWAEAEELFVLGCDLLGPRVLGQKVPAECHKGAPMRCSPAGWGAQVFREVWECCLWWLRWVEVEGEPLIVE